MFAFLFCGLFHERIIRHVKVWQSISAEVGKNAARGPFVTRYAGIRCHITEGSVAVIPVKTIRPKIANVHI